MRVCVFVCVELVTHSRHSSAWVHMQPLWPGGCACCLKRDGRGACGDCGGFQTQTVCVGGLLRRSLVVGCCGGCWRLELGGGCWLFSPDSGCVVLLLFVHYVFDACGVVGHTQYKVPTCDVFVRVISSTAQQHQPACLQQHWVVGVFGVFGVWSTRG